MDPFIYLSVAVPIGLALLALNFEIIKDSEYRRAKIRQKEREELIELMESVRKVNVNPDVRDYIKQLKQAVENKK